MAKRIQDIVPGDRRSIRDIPVERPAAVRVTRIAPVKRMSVTPPGMHRRRKMDAKWPLVIVGVVILVAGVAYVGSFYFSRATFTIVAKTIPIGVKSTYVAESKASTDSLTYELVTVHASASTTVPAVDGPQTSSKAQGRVTLYNAGNPQSQRLIAGTRLSDDSGHIYRLTASVAIPGYTKSASTGAIIPGAMVTSVIADQPGDSYNISRSTVPGNLTIPAYKGSPKYDTVYARLASDITGGFIGAKKTLSATVTASTTAALTTQLTSTLTEQALASIPAGYVMFKNGYVSNFSALSIGAAGAGQALAGIQGTLNAIIFKKSTLISKLAGEQAVASFGSFGYTTPGFESILFSISNPKDFSPEKKTSLIFQLKGDMTLVGTIPVEEIRRKLAGASLAETQNILKPYGPVIKTGSGELIPPWSKVPKNINHISIIVKE